MTSFNCFKIRDSTNLVFGPSTSIRRPNDVSIQSVDQKYPSIINNLNGCLIGEKDVNDTNPFVIIQSSPAPCTDLTDEFRTSSGHNLLDSKLNSRNLNNHQLDKINKCFDTPVNGLSSLDDCESFMMFSVGGLVRSQSDSTCLSLKLNENDHKSTNSKWNSTKSKQGSLESLYKLCTNVSLANFNFMISESHIESSIEDSSLPSHFTQSSFLLSNFDRKIKSNRTYQLVCHDGVPSYALIDDSMKTNNQHSDRHGLINANTSDNCIFSTTITNTRIDRFESQYAKGLLKSPNNIDKYCKRLRLGN